MARQHTLQRDNSSPPRHRDCDLLSIQNSRSIFTFQGMNAIVLVVEESGEVKLFGLLGRCRKRGSPKTGGLENEGLARLGKDG